MAGLVLRRTNFKDVFYQRQILTVDQNFPRYLLTPVGQNYLNILQVAEVSNEHVVLESPSISTKNVRVKVQSEFSSEYENLYERMQRLKRDLDCSFDFRVN